MCQVVGLVQGNLGLVSLFETLDRVEWDPFVLDGRPIYVLRGSSWVVKHSEKLRGDVSFKNMEEFIAQLICQYQTRLVFLVKGISRAIRLDMIHICGWLVTCLLVPTQQTSIGAQQLYPKPAVSK